MRSLLRRAQALHPEKKANLYAAGVALLALIVLRLECPPRPAGADTIRISATKVAPVVLTQKTQAAPVEEKDLSPEELSHRNLQKKITMLEKGIAFLKSTPDYTATFTKQEVVNGELLDLQTMDIKVRHEPFSIYLKWQDFDAGREVMYVDGLNDGKMLVKSGTGIKSRLPAILLAPDSSLALQEARYPVTRAGLLGLATTIVGFNSKDLESKNYSSCKQMEDQPVGDRMCACFVLEYRNREVSPEYRKSITLIDKEWGVPLYIKNFGWAQEDMQLADAELDEATLTEHYTYAEVKFRSSLSALDFDHTNEDYRFQRN